MARGHVVIPRSKNPERLAENIQASDFTMEQEEVDEISKLDVGHRICDNYPWLLNNSMFA
jgi:2,5-diketo-D-gluconate reductase A